MQLPADRQPNFAAPGAPEPAAGGSRQRGWRAASLERRLPILMTGLLAVVLATSLALTYGTLTRAAEESAHDRLQSTVRQVATTVEDASEARVVAMSAAARDTAVLRVMREGVAVPAGRAPAALHGLRAPADTMLAVELWSASGQPLATTQRAAKRTKVVAGEVRAAPAATARVRWPAAGERAAFGPLYVDGDRVFFWTAVPVSDGDRVVGYLAQQRRVGGPRNASRALQGLIGQEVTMYLLNADGTTWTLAPGDPATPPARVDTTATGLRHERGDAGAMLATRANVSGTPWAIVLESPLRAVHARSRSTLYTLAFIGALMMVFGALLAWLLSRRITRPLASVTVAAEGIARGDFARRVIVKRSDEMGRLAASFNRMAEEIDQSRRELERRMAEAEVARTEAEEARHRADEANRAKSHFLATMSHELRTPLNAIAGYTDLLCMGLYGPVTDAQRDALARINRSQGHLLRLINDVLHFVKLTAGQVPYTLTSVALAPALAELEELVAPQMQAKRLRFRLTPLPPGLHVRADREKLQQIVLNLLSNAVKFTPEDGAIDIVVERRDGDALVHVHDTGIGIPQDRLAEVFDAFVQVDRAFHRPSEGIGLGLAISRDLAQGMGGDLTVRSEVDRGTTFTLVLPVAAVEASAAD